MKRLAILAVVALGALASVTAAQAGNTTVTNTSTPISFSDFVSCANGGVGEIVDFSGDLHTLSRVTINGNRVNTDFHQNYQGLKGTGETTGDTYIGNAALHGTFNGSLTNGQMTETFTEHIHYNGQGSAPNLTVTEVGHFTVNANGEVTVFFDKFSVDCG